MVNPVNSVCNVLETNLSLCNLTLSFNSSINKSLVPLLEFNPYTFVLTLFLTILPLETDSSMVLSLIS